MLRILDIYAEVAEDVMAMPVIKGVKTHAEKFAGALRSYSIEAMMQNGLALQAGTSHDLGQNFGKAFDVQFQNKEGQLDYVWQTSWGVSTRLIGGLIMSHSDDKGLVLPPKLAPVKAVLVPIYRKDEEKAQVLEAAHRIAKDVGAKVDDREGANAQARSSSTGSGAACRWCWNWGRAIWPSGNIVLKRRDTGTKEPMPQAEIAAQAAGGAGADAEGSVRRGQAAPQGEHRAGELDRERSKSILNDVTAEKGGGKFVMAHLKDDPACDARMKEFKATIRCIPLVDEYDGAGKCIVTGETVDRRVVIAKAY